MNLIPKDTTAGNATCAVLPHLSGAIEAISFRVPTHIVSASDLSICVRRTTSVDDVNLAFSEAERARPNVVRLEREPLVSSDYMRMRQSCIVDARRTKVIGGRMLKVVTWYDNEWGYSNRVLDVARLACAPCRMPA
jgi:glyceraldehyde-3-phosphate dehydrogenase/erythrose-4-phosphate dehydrogenase